MRSTQLQRKLISVSCSETWRCMHLPTELRMLSQRASSIIVRSSPIVTRDLLRSSWQWRQWGHVKLDWQEDDKPHVEYLVVWVHSWPRSFDYLAPFGSWVEKGCNDDVRVCNILRSAFWTYSCFNVPRSSFIRPSSASTSRRSAAVADLIEAEEFRVRIVTSVRISDNAALNKYACYIS